jgi:hypothetical protein
LHPGALLGTVLPLGSLSTESRLWSQPITVTKVVFIRCVPVGLALFTLLHVGHPPFVQPMDLPHAVFVQINIVGLRHHFDYLLKWRSTHDSCRRPNNFIQIIPDNRLIVTRSFCEVITTTFINEILGVIIISPDICVTIPTFSNLFFLFVGLATTLLALFF